MGQARSQRTRKPKASKPAAEQAEAKATEPEAPARAKLPKLTYDMSLLKGTKNTKDEGQEEVPADGLELPPCAKAMDGVR